MLTVGRHGEASNRRLHLDLVLERELSAIELQLVVHATSDEAIPLRIVMQGCDGLLEERHSLHCLEALRVDNGDGVARRNDELLFHLADIKNGVFVSELADKLNELLSEVDLPLLDCAVLPGRDDRLAIDPAQPVDLVRVSLGLDKQGTIALLDVEHAPSRLVGAGGHVPTAGRELEAVDLCLEVVEVAERQLLRRLHHLNLA